MHKALIVLALLLLIFGIYKLLHIKTASVIQNGQAVSRNYKPKSAATAHIDKPLFSMDILVTWAEAPTTRRVDMPNYTFKSPLSAAQILEVYIDNIPAGMAINRAISVSANGAGISHEDVSDNCTEYTEAVRGQTSVTGKAPAKWQNLQFICDTGNYRRDVIGTASPDGINTLNLTGPTVGSHKVFLLYTDNNINPDYAPLYGILDSFKLK